MQVLFTSDLHLGHKNIHKFRAPFSTAKEHDEYILNEFSKFNKRTIIYILGDFLFDSENYDDYLKTLSKFPFFIKLIMGNHDSKKLYSQSVASNISIELPLFTYKNSWMSHCPIHPHELRNRAGNIHGHMHNESLEDLRYFNVNLDVNNYKFVELETILTQLGAANASNS